MKKHGLEETQNPEMHHVQNRYYSIKKEGQGIKQCKMTCFYK